LKEISRIGAMNYVLELYDAMRIEVPLYSGKVYTSYAYENNYPKSPFGLDLKHLLDSNLEVNGASRDFLLAEMRNNFVEGDDSPGIRRIRTYTSTEEFYALRQWRELYGLFRLVDWSRFLTYFLSFMNSLRYRVIVDLSKLQFNDSYYFAFFEGSFGAIAPILTSKPVLIRICDIYYGEVHQRLFVKVPDPLNQVFTKALEALNMNANVYTQLQSIPTRLGRVDVAQTVKDVAVCTLLPYQLDFYFEDSDIFDPMQMVGVIWSYCFIPQTVFSQSYVTGAVRYIQKFIPPRVLRRQMQMWIDDNKIDIDGDDPIRFENFWTVTYFKYFDEYKVGFGGDRSIFHDPVLEFDITARLFGRTVHRFGFYGVAKDRDNQCVESYDYDEFGYYYDLFRRLINTFTGAGNGDRNKRRAVHALGTWALESFRNYHISMIQMNLQLDSVAANAYMMLPKLWEDNLANPADVEFGVQYVEDIWRLDRISIPFDPSAFTAMAVRMRENDVITTSADLDYMMQGLSHSVDFINSSIKLALLSELRTVIVGLDLSKKEIIRMTMHGNELYDKVLKPNEDVYYNTYINQLYRLAETGETINSRHYLEVKDELVRQAGFTLSGDDYMGFGDIGRMLAFKHPVATPYLYVMYQTSSTHWISIPRGTDRIIMPGIMENEAPNFDRVYSFRSLESELYGHNFTAFQPDGVYAIGPVPYDVEERDVKSFTGIRDEDLFEYKNEEVFLRFKKLKIPFYIYDGRDRAALVDFMKRRTFEIFPIYSNAFLSFFFPENAEVLTPQFLDTVDSEFIIPKLDSLYTFYRSV
jgi:hypothetical protein